MSVSRTAVRIAAARALMNRTLAGAHVHDSTIEPIDVAVSEARQPFITVTTDDDTTEGVGRSLYEGRRELDLVIEVAVASKIESGEFTIPETDFGLEWALDIIEHQIERALLDEGSQWSSIFMALVPRIYSKVSRRGASAERGVRFAARQIVLKLDTVLPPPEGADIDAATPYGRLLAAMDGDQELSAYGAFLRTVLEGTARPDWLVASQAIGMTREDAEAIGIAPLHPTDLEPAVAEQGIVDVGPTTVDLTIRAEDVEQ